MGGLHMQPVGAQRSGQRASSDQAQNAFNLATWLAQVDVRMVGIGVSVVESEKQREVLYIWLGAEPSVAFSDRQDGVHAWNRAGMSLSLWRRRHEDGLALAITCLQVDNLTHAAACPVVVCRSHASRLASDASDGATFALTLAKTSFSGSPIQVGRVATRVRVMQVRASRDAARRALPGVAPRRYRL
jgi:hypothetical protein